MEDSRSVAGWLGGQEVLNNSILDVDQVIANINAVTTEELSRIARELIRSEHLRLGLVGPMADAAPLEKLLNL